MSDKVRVGVAVLIYEQLQLPSREETPRVLLGLRKGAHGAGTWSLPGGRMEWGEEPLTTAYRESLEETGLSLVDIKPIVSYPYNSYVIEGQHWITLFFTGQILEGSYDSTAKVEVKEPDKCERWDWFHFDRLPEPLFPPARILFEHFVNPEFIRASGDCLCPECDRPYYDHPAYRESRSWHGGFWLNKLCDGTLVKL